MNSGNAWTLVILAGLAALILGLSLGINVDIHLPGDNGDPLVPSNETESTNDNVDTEDVIVPSDQGGSTDRTARLFEIAKNVAGEEVSPCNSTDISLCSPEELALDHMINIDDFDSKNKVMEERFILIGLFFSTIGVTYSNPWVDWTMWLSNMNHCHWRGITGCTGDEVSTVRATVGSGRVTKINLSSNNLSGSIPSNLGKLMKLEILNLSNNTLSGKIPNEIENLSSLRRLRLDNNLLDGFIPRMIEELEDLYYIDISSNRFSGEIPSGLCGLDHLKADCFLCVDDCCSECVETSSTVETCATVEYHHISGKKNAERLDISDIDDGTGTVQISLDFDFRWLGGTNTARYLVVDTNGQIYFETTYANEYYPWAINGLPIGDYEAPRIAVINNDLVANNQDSIIVNDEVIITSEDNSGVFVLRQPDSIIISWEKLFFSSEMDGSPRSAQAQIFSDGQVSICYGNEDTDIVPLFAAGIEGGAFDGLFPNGPKVAYTLPGEPWNNSTGMTDEWPSNLCYCFNPIERKWD